MKKFNKVALFGILGTILAMALCACSQSKSNLEADNNKINVVATIYPEYDFLREIGGDNINLTMLLTPGAESHSYEPTPQDIKNVTESDMFVYVGGDSDAWVDSILESVDTTNIEVVTLMDCVDVVSEELVEGMMAEEEESEEEEEYDEHVWTSPKNAILIVEKLCESLCEIDSENADEYRENTKAYVEELTALDEKFREVVANGNRTEIVVGDRFPFRYFVDEYGLTYYAAFPGCSTDTEANAATIAFLSNKVKEDNIPVVFHIELSNEKLCDSICEETGAKSMTLNAAHNISKDDFDAGVTYLDVMEQNVVSLREALQ